MPERLDRSSIAGTHRATRLTRARWAGRGWRCCSLAHAERLHDLRLQERIERLARHALDDHAKDVGVVAVDVAFSGLRVEWQRRHPRHDVRNRRRRVSIVHIALNASVTPCSRRTNARESTSFDGRVWPTRSVATRTTARVDVAIRTAAGILENRASMRRMDYRAFISSIGQSPAECRPGLDRT